MTLVAIVGMTGAGKSEVSWMIKRYELAYVRLGEVMEEEIIARGWDRTPENERIVQRELREQFGMDVYAVRSTSKIEQAISEGDGNVVIDGVYSRQEAEYLKKTFGDDFKVVAVVSGIDFRYQRLATREIRPFTYGEAALRDENEIKNVDKAYLIAMANYYINNQGDIPSLEKQVDAMLRQYNLIT